jgi:hypothetical protein
MVTRSARVNQSAQVNQWQTRPGEPTALAFWRGFLVGLPLAGILWGGLALLVRAVLSHLSG